jgi:hypothetical protein
VLERPLHAHRSAFASAPRLAAATSGATPAEREAAQQTAIKLRADLHEKVT